MFPTLDQIILKENKVIEIEEKKEDDVTARVHSFLAYVKVKLAEKERSDYQYFPTAPQIISQRTLLIILIDQAGVSKSQRKNVLSAIMGFEVVTQKELNWNKHSAIIDAIKAEDDNGTLVLKKIENDIISNPTCGACNLYGSIWTSSDMPDL